MKTIKIIFLFIVFFFNIPKSSAETWSEPWQKEIIQKADYFILGKVLSIDEEKGAEIEVIKTFGEKLPNKIHIDGFSLLQLMSSSGHGVHLDFEKDQMLYLLLTKGDNGNYLIPTPTSGFAILDKNNNVMATYRISFHQALVPKDIYEKTYQEIWNYYKKGSYDKKIISSFVEEQLGKKPAGFEETEIETFFLQHVALETAYLLDMEITLAKLRPFISIENFHSRVSALQALSNTKEKIAKDYLFEYISDSKNSDFEKVIAIWALAKCGKEEYKQKLKNIASNLSDNEDVGFGLNIMDPRIATYFPTPKGAVESL